MAAKATAIFDADDARLHQAIARIDRGLLAVQARFAAMGLTAAKYLVAPAAVIAGLTLGIKSAADAGGHFNDEMQNTGVGVENLVVLEQEFRNAGKAGEDVGRVFAKMQKVLGDGSANEFIRDLGIDLEELKGMAPLDQFHRLGSAIAALKSPTDRNNASMAIFGKSGATLLAMFSSKGFGEAAGQVGAQARILAENAALFDDASDKLALAGVKTQGFFVGVAERVVPVLKPLLDDFARLDLAAQGQTLGDAIAGSLLAVATGDVWPIMGLSLMVSLGEAVNFLVSGLLSAVGFFGAAFTDLMGKIHSALINAVLAAVSVLENAPLIGKDVKGYVAGRRGALIRDEAANERERDAIRGIGKYGQIIDTSALSSALFNRVGKSIDQANTLGGIFRALHPTTTPAGGVAGLFGGDTSAVSALGRIGGAFGGGAGGDPLIEANRLAAHGNDWLARIYQAVAKDMPATASPAVYGN